MTFPIVCHNMFCVIIICPWSLLQRTCLTCIQSLWTYVLWQQGVLSTSKLDWLGTLSRHTGQSIKEVFKGSSSSGYIWTGRCLGQKDLFQRKRKKLLIECTKHSKLNRFLLEETFVITTFWRLTFWFQQTQQ